MGGAGLEGLRVNDVLDPERLLQELLVFGHFLGSQLLLLGRGLVALISMVRQGQVQGCNRAMVLQRAARRWAPGKERGIGPNGGSMMGRRGYLAGGEGGDAAKEAEGQGGAAGDIAGQVALPCHHGDAGSRGTGGGAEGDRRNGKGRGELCGAAQDEGIHRGGGGVHLEVVKEVRSRGRRS